MTRLSYLEVKGFRSFGAEAQRIDFSAPLAVIHGDNSQGKTSLLEAAEFLFTGETSRRALLGGAPSEFERCLRNVHLSASEAVYVEAGIVNDQGIASVVRRELLHDYRGASGCESALTIDGYPVASLADTGLVVGDVPAMAAPVLLQHSLRYAVAAKPTERTEYFKALLEVDDLEIVRSTLARVLRWREAQQVPTLIATLRRVAKHPQFSSHLSSCEKTPNRVVIESSLKSALTSIPGVDENIGDLASARAAALTSLRGRQADVFPLSDIRVGPSPSIAENEIALPTSLAEYQALAESASDEVSRLLPLFAAALALPEIHEIGDAIDCPLCGTEGGMTPARVSQVRGIIAAQSGLVDVGRKCRDDLSRVTTRVVALHRQLVAVPPACARWTDEQKIKENAAVTELGAPDTWLPQLLSRAAELDQLCENAAADARTALELLDRLDTRTERVEPHDPSEVNATGSALHSLAQAVARVRSFRDSWALELGQPAITIQTAVESRTDTEGWESLSTLADQVDELLAQILAHKRSTAATLRLRRAVSDVDTAVQQVMDRRFDEMGDDIGRWWQLLRPNDLVSFTEVVRKGSGKRSFDITATLTAALGDAGVVRNAISVLSDSQLDALGLAAFAARCHLGKSPVIMLDDPVPASDPEHSLTFASKVVESLLDLPLHVVIATSNPELANTLETLHRHRGVDRFSVVLVDPVMGTTLVPSEDDFERLVLGAESQMHSPLIENRRSAGNYLRIAAERLAKLIVIANRRAIGETVSLSDYEGKNLGDLRPLVTSYSLAANEPGLWQTFAKELNPADHDVVPPASARLAWCCGELKQLKRLHRSKFPNLMRP